LGLSAQLETTPEWRPFRFTFLARADDDNARITLTGLTPGRYQLADVSLRPGGIVGLEKDSRLEDDSVSVMQRARTHFTPAARADFADFLRETERRYWDGMFRYLKDELHVRPPVSGTQLSYSPVHVQAGLDYIDAHAYWHHPHFPGRPWDRSNWYVNNKALVNQPGGTLSSLAARRVSGMPFTVSEYNHPAPNEYAAEGFPMIAAVAAFQAWDGVFPFAYCHNTQFEPQKIGSYFDVVSHSTKLVHMPACAAMLVRGHVAPGAKLVEAPLSAAAERDALRRSLDVWSLSADRFGVDAHAALRHRVAIDLTGAARPPEGDDAPTRRFVADTGQIAWGVEHAEAGTFVVDSPATKLFTGFVRGRTLRLGDVTLRIGPTRLDWATVSLTAVDADAIDQPGRVLLAATGVAQNRDAELQRLDGDRITLSDRWGEAPVMCEGIPAVVTLPMSPAQLKCFALDEAGHRRAELPVADADGNAKIELSPTYKTLWYELVVGP